MMKISAFTAAMVAAMAVGCGGGSLPPAASPEQARVALATALDAWRAGESSESLTRHNPPIYFSEQNDRPDVALIDYAVADGYEVYGQSVRLTVVLTLKLPDGTKKERKAKYLIDTSPVVAIVPG